MVRMRSCQKTVLALCGVCLLLGLSAGCPRSEAPQKNPSLPPPQVPTPKQEERDLGKQPESTQQALPAQPSVGQLVAGSPPATPIEMPRVVMAEIDRAKCKVFVGDAIPDATPEDLDGKPVSLKQFFGSRGTVVVFFSVGKTPREQLAASNLLADLQADIVKSHAGAGITVVAVHVGAPNDVLTQVIKEAGAEFPVLVDREAKLATQLSGHSPPTLYLVDGTGKIVWLDIEYNRSVRENLKRAVAALVQETN